MSQYSHSLGPRQFSVRFLLAAVLVSAVVLATTRELELSLDVAGAWLLTVLAAVVALGACSAFGHSSNAG